MTIDPTYPWTQVYARKEGMICDRCKRAIFTGDSYWRCGARAGQRVMTGLPARRTFRWIQACTKCYDNHRV